MIIGYKPFRNQAMKFQDFSIIIEKLHNLAAFKKYCNIKMLWSSLKKLTTVNILGGIEYFRYESDM